MTSISEVLIQKERSAYASLVIRHVRQRIDAEKPFGILEGHGPTGIGKTHAFISRGGVIDFLHDNRVPVIFCCDRWALLDEITRKITKDSNVKPVVVKKKQDAVEDACRFYRESSRDQHAKLVATIAKYYQRDKLKKLFGLDTSGKKPDDGKILDAIKKYLDDKIKDAEKEIERIKLTEPKQTFNDDDDNFPYNSSSNNLINFLSFCRDRDIAFSDPDEDMTNAIRELSENPFYLSLFPACQWFLEPLETVLVTTTHKLVHGFDIGPLKADATTLSLLEKKHMAVGTGTNACRPAAIIFDEFEAQEAAMLSALASQPNRINNPFEFQKVLHEGYADWASQKEEGEWPLVKTAKDFLERFPEPIPARLVAGDGWDGVSTEYTFRSGNAIFSSTTLLGVIEGERKRIVVHRAVGKRVWPGAMPLPRIIGDVGRRNRFSLRQALRFHEKNDYEILACYNSLFDRPGGGKTRHGSVFENPGRSLVFYGEKDNNRINQKERMTVTESHLAGYDIIGLVPRSSGGGLPTSDLDVKHYAMEKTPEGLLAGLAGERFVFGLSATTCLRRVCNHFDMAWVNAFLADRDALIADDEILRKEIGEIVAEEIPGSDCHFATIPSEGALAGIRDWGGLFDKTFNKDRFIEIWRAVTMISRMVPGNGHGCPDTVTCLTFTASFNDVKQVLNASDNDTIANANHAKTRLCDALKMNILSIPLEDEKTNVRSIQAENSDKKDKEKKKAYFLTFEDSSMKSVLLFLLNAAAYKREDDFQRRLDSLKDHAREKEANLFILTMYASSERGVNLLFDGGMEIDTICIIEPPYYHLSSEPADIKSNLRRIQKITEKGVASLEHQNTALKTLIFREGNYYERAVKTFQAAHKETYDHRIASFASLIQAYGRGVRNWRKLSEKTFYISKRLGVDQIKNLAEDTRLDACLPLLGPIGKGLYACINEHAKTDAPEKRKRQQVNEDIENCLQHFAQRLVDYRNGIAGDEVRKYWEGLRDQLLLGKIQYQIPTGLISGNGKKKISDRETTSLSAWAYEECDKTWKAETHFGALVRKMQKNQETGDEDLGSGLKHYFRLEGTILPVECDGKFYRPKSLIVQSIIKPAVSEYIALDALREYGAQRFCEDRRLYELFDIFIPGIKLAVDVKYWGDETVFKADRNGDADKALERLRDIRKILGDDARLVYVLFLDALDDDHFHSAHAFQDKISKDGFAVVRMLDRHDFSLTRGFKAFRDWLRTNHTPAPLG